MPGGRCPVTHVHTIMCMYIWVYARYTYMYENICVWVCVISLFISSAIPMIALIAIHDSLKLNNIQYP